MEVSTASCSKIRDQQNPQSHLFREDFQSNNLSLSKIYQIEVVFDQNPKKKQTFIFCCFNKKIVSQFSKHMFSWVLIGSVSPHDLPSTSTHPMRGGKSSLGWDPNQALQGWPWLGSQKGAIPFWRRLAVEWMEWMDPVTMLDIGHFYRRKNVQMSEYLWESLKFWKTSGSIIVSSFRWCMSCITYMGIWRCNNPTCHSIILEWYLVQSRSLIIYAQYV